MSNSESIHWITKKLLPTSLLPSKTAFSRLSILPMRYLSWYVNVVQPNRLAHLTMCFVQLFGWDLKSLWKTANQKRCHAFLRAGRITEALESYRYMMDMSDEATKASCLNWSTGQFSVISARLVPRPTFYSRFQTRLRGILYCQRRRCSRCEHGPGGGRPRFRVRYHFCRSL
jgi:hypothetical protein